MCVCVSMYVCMCVREREIIDRTFIHAAVSK